MATWMLDGPDKLDLDPVHRVEIRIVEGAPLRVRSRGGNVTVDYEHPWRPGLLGWLTTRGRRRAVLSLAVPRDCQVELHGVSASLMVGGLRAPVLARSVSGEITLAGLGGSADAESVSGAVQASGITGDLSAKTISGDLTVAEGGGGSVRARTVSGAVAVDLLASGKRDVNLSSVSGDLTVRLPGGSDLQVKLQSVSGQVASAFEELEHEHAPGRRAARGRLGAGTGRLRATSTSGHVALLRRAPEASP